MKTLWVNKEDRYSWNPGLGRMTEEATQAWIQWGIRIPEVLNLGTLFLQPSPRSALKLFQMLAEQPEGQGHHQRPSRCSMIMCAVWAVGKVCIHWANSGVGVTIYYLPAVALSCPQIDSGGFEAVWFGVGICLTKRSILTYPRGGKKCPSHARSHL